MLGPHVAQPGQNTQAEYNMFFLSNMKMFIIAFGLCNKKEARLHFLFSSTTCSSH